MAQSQIMKNQGIIKILTPHRIKKLICWQFFVGKLQIFVGKLQFFVGNENSPRG